MNDATRTKTVKRASILIEKIFSNDREKNLQDESDFPLQIPS